MRALLLAAAAALVSLPVMAQDMTFSRPVFVYQTVTYTNTGANSWTVPAGVTSACFLMIGGGAQGGGGYTGGGGGGGGKE